VGILLLLVIEIKREARTFLALAGLVDQANARRLLGAGPRRGPLAVGPIEDELAGGVEIPLPAGAAGRTEQDVVVVPEALDLFVQMGVRENRERDVAGAVAAYVLALQ